MVQAMWGINARIAFVLCTLVTVVICTYSHSRAHSASIPRSRLPDRSTYRRQWTPQYNRTYVYRPLQRRGSSRAYRGLVVTRRPYYSRVTSPYYGPGARPSVNPQPGGVTTTAEPCWIAPAATCRPDSPYRTIDGSCNNLANPTWGQSLRPIGRRLPAQYNPGSRSDMRTIGVTGRPLPSTRKVSTSVLPLATRNDFSKTLTTMHMTWGQFIDHDITHVPLTGPMSCCNQAEANRHPNCIPIAIPSDDETFGRQGRTCMELRRSMAILPGQCGNEHRQQLNNLTSYIDGGLVYGSTPDRARQLRSMKRGEMADSDGKYHLPVEKPGTKCDIPPINHPDRRCFAAGDRRSNEWGGLTSLHVTFIREHNRIAQVFYRQLKQTSPHMTEDQLDETVYQEVRRIIAAYLQVINYKEYLPNVLGEQQMIKWRLHIQTKAPTGTIHKYNPRLDATSTNVFGTAAFRFGHSEVPFGVQPKTSVYHNSSRFVSMIELFNQPSTYREYHNDNILRGMLVQPSLKVSKFAPEVRNNLFDRSFNGSGLDLPAVSMQRAREHGLPPYNAWRRFCNLPTVTFSNMPDHTVEQARKFASVYDHHDDIDLFAAAVTEKLVTPDAHVGPTFACLLGQEFKRLKEGDRFWFENQGTYPNSFTPHQISQLSRITLSKIVCETTANTDWVPANAFRLDSSFVRCRDLPGLDLENWLNLSRGQRSQTG